MSSKRILIVGDAIVDVHLRADGTEDFVQLGGVFHAARTMASIHTNYALAYYAPQYLSKSISDFGSRLNAEKIYQLGQIDGAPSVMLISESTEAGNQGYIDILREQREIIDRTPFLDVIKDYEPTDIIIFPGYFDLLTMINSIKNLPVKVHIDFQYIKDPRPILSSGNKIETAIFSSSANYFSDVCNSSPNELIEKCDGNVCTKVLLKENRGGSRLYDYSNHTLYQIPSFPVPTVHSVGVGDCFNSVYVALFGQQLTQLVLIRASYIASLYASTWDFHFFQKLAEAALSISKEDLEIKPGIRVPWESRKNIEIYIAAPDFPDVDTRIIDKVAENLRYHNFIPHLPVRENGLIKDTDPDEKQNLAFQKDIELLEKRQLLIAVLLYDDPGTLVELGYFAKSGKCSILFDPYNLAKNMFLRKTPTLTCTTLGQLTDAVYELAGRIIGGR